MYQAFLIKYAEIGIKGKNRYIFEDALVEHIRRALKKVEGNFRVTKEQGRIYAFPEEAYDFEETVEALKRVFGIAAICPVVVTEDQGYEKLAEAVVGYVQKVYPASTRSFKVHARRARKSYPMDSMELNRELGGAILAACPGMRVDVHQPDIWLTGGSAPENIYLLRRDSGTRRHACGDQRKRHAAAVRGDRLTGGRLYDREKGRED